jgi:ABC-type lipoprotein export system ATPase subunit
MTKTTSGRYHRILGLDVAGGFLDGLKLEFSADLNCLIGGRGAGKTTALELLRWALKDSQGGAAARADLQKLVRANLGKEGRVRVAIETKDGLRYTVERGLDGDAEVLGERGRATGLTLAHGVIFDLDVYSQSEIESIAMSPTHQLGLIDRVAGGELRDVQERLRGVRAELDTNAREVQSLGRDLRELDAALEELPVVREKVASLRPTGAAPGLDAAVAEKGQRERESRAVAQTDELLRRERDALEQAIVALGAEPAVPAPALRGPNRDALRAVAEAVDECRHEVKAYVLGARGALDRCAARLDAARRLLAAGHEAQDKRYWDLMALHDRERVRSQERLHFERRLHELQERQQLRDQRRDALQAKLAHRRALLASLSALRDERFTLRRAVADGWSAQLAPAIRVSLRQGADRTAFRAALLEAFREPSARKKAQDVVERVADAYTPSDLVATLARDEAADDIAELGFTKQKAGWFVEELRESGVPALAESVDLEDVPQIELKDGRAYKVAAHLSTGQKCTTILPILLLESERPLLIDQPEDNLDNSFIYETIVSQVRGVKRQRQLIFVTHNPNIPVLGEASRVFVLRSDGAQARLHAVGAVDDVRDDVATILEGGRAAFEARRARYGY